MTATHVSTTRSVIQGAIHALEERGHAKYTLLNPVSGRLCLLGALDVGSGRASIVQTNPEFPTYFLSPGFVSSEEYEAHTVALDHAIEVVAQVIRDLPAPDGREEDWEYVLQRQNPNGVVADWNDEFCDGGEEALLVLKHAAEACGD